MSDNEKLIEKVKCLKDNPPYDTMLKSEIMELRHSAENACIGWVGALQVVLVLLDADLPPTGIKK